MRLPKYVELVAGRYVAVEGLLPASAPDPASLAKAGMETIDMRNIEQIIADDTLFEDAPCFDFGSLMSLREGWLT